MKSQDRVKDCRKMIQTSSSSSTTRLSVTADQDFCDIAMMLEKLKSKIAEMEFKLDEIKTTILLAIKCYQLFNQVRHCE